MNGNGIPDFGADRQIFTNTILDIQLPSRLQDEDPHGCKLLAKGSDAEFGLGGIGYVVFTIRQPISFTQ